MDSPWNVGVPMTHGHAVRTVGRVSVLATAIVTCMALLLVSCTPTRENPPVEVKIGEVTRPEWVDTGRHNDYPPETHVFATRTGNEGLPPGREEMLWRLCERVQALIAERLEREKAGQIASAARRGMWVGPQHLPLEEFHHQQWTDGFVSMGFATMPRSAIGQNARDLLARRPSVLQKPTERWQQRSTAQEDMKDRVRAYSAGTDELVLRVLAGLDLSASVQLESGLIEGANHLYQQAAQFREYVGFHLLSGGDQRVELGRQPAVIECQFVWMGQPAQGLPLRSILSGQKGAGPLVSDDLGTATLRFTGPATFTGAESNPVGFALDWDLLLPYGQTGIDVLPFTTSLTLPAVGNTVIALTLTEKIGNRTVTDGPIRRGIKQWLEDSGVQVLEEKPDRDEPRFVLEIGGVVTVTEMDRAGAAAIRQVRASGTVLLRTWAGPVLATVSPVEGLGRYVMPAAGRDSEAARESLNTAGTAALEDAWGVWKATIATRFREAFPPIFPMSAEQGPKAD